MLLTNERLDKLAASQADFTARGMLSGSFFPATGEASQPTNVGDDDDDDDDAGEVEGDRVEAETVLARKPCACSQTRLTVLT